MKNLKILKTAAIISFLIIVFPGKIAFVNFIAIFMGIINFILMLGVEPMNMDFIVSLLTIASIVLIFYKNKYLILFGIIVQVLYLIYTFNITFLGFWYYYLPTLTYLILSLTLIYFLVFKQNEHNKEVE